MASGEIRIVVSHGFPQRAQIGPIEAFEPTDWFGPEGGGRFTTFYVPTEDDGWTQEIDGMPAKLVVAEGSGAVGSDEVRTWAVFPPGGFAGLWFIRASLQLAPL